MSDRLTGILLFPFVAKSTHANPRQVSKRHAHILGRVISVRTKSSGQQEKHS